MRALFPVFPFYFQNGTEELESTVSCSFLFFPIVLCQEHELVKGSEVTDCPWRSLTTKGQDHDITLRYKMSYGHSFIISM